MQRVIIRHLPNFLAIGQIWWFNSFQDGGWLPCWIFKILNFIRQSRAEGQYASPLPRYYDHLPIFQDHKIAAVRGLELLKLRDFNCRYGLESQYALLSQISCRSVSVKRWRDMAIFQFLKMAAARILGLFYTSFHLPWKAFGGLRHCAKCGWNRFNSFDNMEFNILRVWGGWAFVSTIKWGVISTNPPKGTSFDAKTSYDA